MAGLIVMPFAPSREHYRQIKKMASDRDAMPRTYNSHLASIQGAVLRFQAEGIGTCLVAVDPVQLHRWCAKHRRHCDAAARLAFCRELLIETPMQKDLPNV
jgi:hypothetical protein